MRACELIKSCIYHHMTIVFMHIFMHWINNHAQLPGQQSMIRNFIIVYLR